MSDRVIGIAVLNWRHGDACGYLHYVGEHADGRRFIDWIQVVGDGAPDPPGGGTYWRFKGDESEWLHCHPSINDLSRKWHNTYNWSVKHVRFHDFPDDHWPAHLVRKLNDGLFKPDECPINHTW